MTSYRFFVLCLSLAAMLVLASGGLVYAQPSAASHAHIRVNGCNYYVQIVPFDLQGNVLRDQHGNLLSTETVYANYEDCGNLNHRTRKGDPDIPGDTNRYYFAHAHVCWGFPAVGIDIESDLYPVTEDNADLVTEDDLYFVTEDNVEAYWTHHYASYSLSSHDAVNNKYNCYGYALGYDTWLLGGYCDCDDCVSGIACNCYVVTSGIELIYRCDYNKIQEPVEGCRIDQGGHIIVVVIMEDVWSWLSLWWTKVITTTEEKNWQSRMYEIYRTPSDQPPGTYYKRKP